MFGRQILATRLDDSVDEFFCMAAGLGAPGAALTEERLLEAVLEAHLQQHVAANGLSEAERARGADEVMGAIRRYGKQT